MSAADLINVLLGIATLTVAVFVAWMVREERMSKLESGELRQAVQGNVLSQSLPAISTVQPGSNLRFMPAIQSEVGLA